MLKKSIEVNGYKNIIAQQKAVSNQKGTIKLYLQDMSTHRIYKTHEAMGEIEIEAVSLDEEFRNNEDRIDIIKMDIEGSEALALQSMKNILEKSKKLKIFVEFFPILISATGRSPQEFNELRKYGFKLFHINAEKRKLEPININKQIEAYGGICINLLCLKGA